MQALFRRLSWNVQNELSAGRWRRMLGSLPHWRGKGAVVSGREKVARDATRDPARLRPRPPVVTVMGHVDHGKTTLLDWLRSTSTAAKEAGGITQHIGAFSVQLSTGDRLTFLDTPGHAAFSAMRARGAGLTDIVVLVVAADDGVMAQTRECVDLVGQAGVPLVVAINKCDKTGADPEQVERELLQCGVQLEKFGGDVQAVKISGLTGSGVPLLEEALLAEAELSCLKGDPEGPVEAVVVEAHVDRGLGPVASMVVCHGTLQCGDVLVAGQGWGKVRSMFDENRKTLREAPPSSPVLTVGWRQLPAAGERCLQVESEAVARDIIRHRATSRQSSSQQLRKGEGKRSVGVVVKGDVVGSVEVLVGILETKQPEGVAINVVHSGVGTVVDSDVEMAASTDSVVMAFGVSCTKAVETLAKRRGVAILTHNVIYKLLDLLKGHVEGVLPWTEEEEVVGEAVVLKTFHLTGARAADVGGCRVKVGRLLRSATYRLIRDGKVIHEGPVSAMKIGKSDVSEARKETECGLSFSSSSVTWKEGDRVVAFTTHRRPPTLHWDFGF